MIADVELYNVPHHQMANRQFVVGDLGEPIKTFPNVKVGNGPILDIGLPWDDTLSNANIGQIGDRCYDIVGIDDSTHTERSIQLRLMYNAVTSLLRKDTDGKIILNGWWDRCPVITANNPIQIGNDVSKPFARYNLPRLDNGPNGHPVVYYQVTASQSRAAKAGLEAEPRVTIDRGIVEQITTYGGFAEIHPDMLFDGSTNIGVFSPKFYDDTLDSGYYFTIPELISVMTSWFGLDSEAILDVSVSFRTPFSVVISSNKYNFMKTNDQTHNIFITQLPGNTTKGMSMISRSGITTVSDTLTINGISEFQKLVGRWYIVDTRGNEIAQIPNELITGSTLEMDVRTVSDVTGITTQVEIGGKIYTIPEGKLPWLGPAWSDYMIRNMEYDREALNRAVETSREQRNIDSINALGNSMLTLGLAGATNPMGAVAGVAQMGLGLATSEMQRQLDVKNLYAKQHAKEGQIRNMPPSAYQSGYGVDYLMRGYYQPAHIRLDMPINISETDYMNYIKHRGYPCGMYRSVELPNDGYIRGNIYNDYSSIGNAVETDMLRKEIATGCRIVIM